MSGTLLVANENGAENQSFIWLTHLQDGITDLDWVLMQPKIFISSEIIVFNVGKCSC